MSAIARINDAAKTDAERLMLATLAILRLETTVTMLEMSLTAALTTMKIYGADTTVIEQSLKRALNFSEAA